MVGGPVLSIDREDAVDSILQLRGEQISPTEAEACVDRIPTASPDRVQALAQLLSLTAEQVSRTPREDFSGPRRRTEQQSRISEQIHTLKGREASGEVFRNSPLEKERQLLVALRRGDNDTGRRILNELLGLIFFAAPRFEQARFRAVELAVLLFRAALEAGGAEGDAMDLSYRYLRRIQRASDPEELADILNIVVERLSRRIFIFRGVKHATTLRRAERYIQDNFTRKLSLAEVAAAAGLSPAYFSTVFKNEMGENFSDYLVRLRNELAARLLVGTDRSLADIAADCGFEDQSWFSKTFKRCMGTSPGRYRESGGALAYEAEEQHET
jgi:AraC-like DNA-binding protein